jgi:hypothetical protein
MTTFFYAIFSSTFAIILQLKDVFIANAFDESSLNKTGLEAVEIQG